MRRWVGFVVGLLSFLVAHEIEVVKWRSWFGGAFEPWFLNSGRAIAFTLGCVCASSAIFALLNASARRIRGVTIAAGSVVGMTAVLFLKKGGAGTIFPIVMAAGAVLILISSMLGAWVGSELAGLVRSRRSPDS